MWRGKNYKVSRMVLRNRVDHGSLPQNREQERERITSSEDKQFNLGQVEGILLDEYREKLPQNSPAVCTKGFGGSLSPHTELLSSPSSTWASPTPEPLPCIAFL